MQPWNLGGKGLAFETIPAEMATKVVLACGKDPQVTTMEEMDQLKHRFILLHASSVEVVSWRQLVQSTGTRWGSKGDVKWRRLNDDELPEYNLLGPQHQSLCWSCLKCWRNGTSAWEYRPMSMETLKDHLAKKHEILNPTEDDYFIDKDAKIESFKRFKGTIEC